MKLIYFDEEDQKELVDILQEAAEEIQNLYGNDIDLTERLYSKATEFEQLEEAIPDKQILKRMITESELDREFIDYICPNCKNILHQQFKGSKEPFRHFRYCYDCGQALDWSDIDE